MAESTRSRSSLWSFSILLLIVLTVNLRMIAPFIITVLSGGIVAILCYPLHRRMTGQYLRAPFSALLLTVAVLVLVIVPSILFVNTAVRQAMLIGQSLAAQDWMSFRAVVQYINQWEGVAILLGDASSLEEQLRGGLESVVVAASRIVLGLAGSLPQALLHVALASLTCYFLLVDGRPFVDWLNKRLPLEREVRARLQESLHRSTVSVIWASAAAAGAQSLVMMFGFLLLGIPGAFLAGGATFIFAWIPVVGSTPVWAAGTAYLFFEGDYIRLALMVGVGLFTGIVDNIVRPWILSGSEGMHPLVTLVAVFGGLQAFGLLGVFFGPILAAILIALLQIWPAVGRRFGLPLGEDLISPGP